MWIDMVDFSYLAQIYLLSIGSQNPFDTFVGEVAAVRNDEDIVIHLI